MTETLTEIHKRMEKYYAEPAGEFAADLDRWLEQARALVSGWEARAANHRATTDTDEQWNEGAACGYGQAAIELADMLGVPPAEQKE